MNYLSVSNACQAIIEAGQFLYQQGWSPATSSNYSVRLGPQQFAVTVSGKHKGQLSEADVMQVSLDGKPIASSLRPSAETRLHAVIYQQLPAIGAVLHTHSPKGTVLSQLISGDQLRLQGYELLKAFPGIHTHAQQVSLPIFENTQDMHALGTETAPHIAELDVPGYLIRGHGLYAWGATMDDCLRHVEAFEFLFECELEKMRVRP